MTPSIDKIRTGRQIRLLMKMRGISVKEVCSALSLGCVQSVYHWLDGKTLPTIDNLYALSELLQVPMDMLLCGNRKYGPWKDGMPNTRRLIRYYTEIQDFLAA